MIRDIDEDEFIFVEKYRPRRVSDCILPQTLLDTFQGMVDAGEFQDLLLTGTTGLGKTTIARAMCEEIGCDYLFINASENNGIDVLRTTIRDFASTVSLRGGTKVVILDEADNMSAALQPALRGFIEEFSKSCRFILTCNYKNKIMDALQSRATTIEFKFTKEDRPKLAAKFFKRLVEILEAENIAYSKEAVVELVQKHFPDFRKTLNELQRYSVSGKIDIGVLGKSNTETIRGLIDSLRQKDFKKARTWIVENSDVDSATIVRMLYDSLVPEVREVPQLILILAECQKHIPWVADQEIHLAACVLEIMGSCSFKDTDNVLR